MQPTTNQMHFFISYTVAFLAFGLIGKWYVWPNIKDRALKDVIVFAYLLRRRETNWATQPAP